MTDSRRHAVACRLALIAAFLFAPALASALPVATFKEPRVEVIEHDRTVSFDILLSPAPASTFKVGLLVDGNAKGGGVDFEDFPTTVTFNAGEVKKTVTVTIVDDHFKERTETIGLSIAGASEGGANLTSMEIAILDDDTVFVPVEVNFAETTSNVSESSGQVEVVLLLNKVPGVVTTINYTVGGTAAAGVNYQPLSGTVTVQPNEIEVYIPVTLINDGVTGPDKSLTFKLTGITGAAHLGPMNVHVMNIQDSGPKNLNVRFVDRESRIMENAGKAYVQLVMSDKLDHDLDVEFMFGGSATPSADYTVPPVTVTFPKGQTTAQIVIPIINDAVLEDAESIDIVLVSAEEARLGQIPSHTVYIIDDEKPFVEFASASSRVSEDAKTHTVTLKTNNLISSSITVNYIVAGTARPGTHYKQLPGSVIIPGNTAAKNIDLELYNDDKENLDRTVLISLYDADNAELGVLTSHTVTIMNDDKKSSAPLAVSPPGVAASVPDVGVDARGRAHIIWRQRQGTQYWIWYARVANGAIDLPAAALYNAGNSANFRPRCAVGPDGQTYVILHNPSTSYLTFVKFMDGRSSPSQSFQLFSPLVWPNQAYYWPAIDLNPVTRRPYIVAECNMNRPHPLSPGVTQFWNGIIGVELDETGARTPGTLWSPYYRLNSAALIDMATRPDVAVDKYGQAHCAWRQKDPDWGGAIGIAYSRQGSGKNIYTELSDFMTRSVLATGGGPSISCNQNGAADVLWSAQDYKSTYWWNGLKGIRTQILDTSATGAYMPATVTSDFSNFFVWTDQREGNKQIYYKTQLSRSRPRNLARGGGDGFDPSLAAGTSDTAACVWADSRDGWQRIYYRAINGTIQLTTAQNYDRDALTVRMTATASDGLHGPVTGQNNNVKFTWKIMDDASQNWGQGTLNWSTQLNQWEADTAFSKQLPPGLYTVYYEISYLDFNGELREGEAEGQFLAEQYFSLSGKITDKITGRPIQNAKVRIGGLAVNSDVNGKYFFKELRSGSGLDIYASHLTHKRYHDVITLKPKQTVKVHNIEMMPASPKPEVVEVKADMDGILLYGLDLPNTYTAEIEWGSGDPKFVEFSINGKPPTRVYTSTTEAKFTIRMNNPAFIKNAHNGNKIIVVAESTNGRSKPFVKIVRLVRQPEFIEKGWLPKILDWIHLPSAKSVELSFKFPSREGPLQDRFMGSIPLVKNLTGYFQMAFGFKLIMDTGKWEASTSLIWGRQRTIDNNNSLVNYNDRLFKTPFTNMKPGLEIGPVRIEWEVTAKAQGYTNEKAWINIDNIMATITYGMKIKLWEWYLIDMLPGVAAFHAVLDKITFYLSEYAGGDYMSLIRVNLYCIFKVRAMVNMLMSNPPGWDQATLDVDIGPEVAYEPKIGGIKLNLYAGGQLQPRLYIYDRKTGSWLRLHLWRGKLYYGIEMTLWGAGLLKEEVVFFDWGQKLPNKLADSLPVVEIDGKKYYMLRKSSGPGPMDRPAALGDTLFVANAAAGKAATKTGAALSALDAFRSMGKTAAERALLGLTKANLALVQNVFDDSEPALAANGNKLMLLFVADNGNPTPYQFTNINWMAYDGAAWSSPLPIASDNLGEFAPSVAYDGSGNAVAVWERISDPTITTPDLDAMAAKHEIVYSCKTPAGAWTAPAPLTSNNYLDYKPRLCGPMSDGSLLVVWMANPRNLFVGRGADGTTSNSQVLWRKWNPAAKTWAAAQTMIGNLTNNMTDALAGRGAAAVYAWTRDEDGILSTTQDHDIYACTWNGAGWNAPARLTNDTNNDDYVHAAVTGGGKTYLTWNRNDEIVLNAELTSTSMVRTGTVTGTERLYTITGGPNDNLAMVWQDMSVDGSDAHYAVYDPATARWSQPARLFTDAALERSFAAAWDNANNLTVAYNKVDIQHTTHTFTMDGGALVEVPNYMERGRTDLGIIKTSLGCDLALPAGEMHVYFADSVPGSQVLITASIANTGNLAAGSPVVAFYDGTPSPATEIARTTIPGWLDGAAITTATADWKVPAADAAHTIYAVIDPDHVLNDVNRANNTASVRFGDVDLITELGQTRVSGDGSGWVIAQVGNLGTVSSPATVVGLRRMGAQSPMVTAAAPAVPPGKMVEVSLELPRGTVPTGTIGEFSLTADENRAANDADRENNTVGFSINNERTAAPVQFVTSARTVPVVEGSRRAFTVKLSDRPTTTIQAQVVCQSGDASLSVFSGAAITFTRDTWTSAHTVTLSAAADADTIDGEAEFAIRETTAEGLDQAVVTALELDTGAVHAYGQGTLAGTTLWNDAAHDYVINGTLTIPAGSTLRIGPGARVRLNAGAGKTALVVQGTLETTDTLFILETRHAADAATRVNGINVASGGQASFRRCTLLTRELGSVFAGNYLDWSAAVAAAGSARLNVCGCAFEALDGTGGARTPLALSTEAAVTANVLDDAVSGTQNAFTSFDTGLDWRAGTGLKLVDAFRHEGCRWSVRLQGAAAARDIVLRNTAQALAGPLALSGSGRRFSLEPGSELAGDSAGAILDIPAGTRAAIVQARLVMAAPITVSGQLDASDSTLLLHTGAQWQDYFRRNGIDLQGGGVATLARCNLLAAEDNYTGEWSAMIAQSGLSRLSVSSCSLTLAGPSGYKPTAAIRCAGTRVLEVQGSAFLGNNIGIRFDAVPTTATLRGNAFAGNTIYAVQNRTTTNVDARYNWWGAASGPTHPTNPAGTGDRVSDYVIFANRLTAAPASMSALIDPAAGQETNNLAAAEQPATELIGLRANPPGLEIQQLVFHLSHRGYTMGWNKIGNFRLVMDTNGNGKIDDEEAVQVGGEPVLTALNDDLWVTFSGSIAGTEDPACGFILLADLGNVATGDGFVVELEPGAALMAGGTPFLMQVSPVTHVRGGGVILSDRPGGQFGNHLGSAATQKGIDLFAFSLSGGRTVNRLDVNLTGIQGIAQADLTSASLFVDLNGNGQRDGGEPKVGGAGAVTISGATGTIRFSTPFASGQTYLLTADLAGLAAGDKLTFNLTAGAIVLNQGAASGQVRPATHTVEAPITISGLSSSYLVDVLLPAKLVYRDLSHAFTSSIPWGVYRQQYIRTLNSQRDQVAETQISFRVNRRVRVYVGIDDMMPAAPSWLNAWAVERERLQTTDPHPGRRLYSRPFNAGPVTLGGNRNTGGVSGYQMYTVVIVPEAGTNAEAEDWALYQ